ncbi:hypothetical protein E1301_Tti015735 [Triplophysa tibetana]|uniref:CCHC-type domain-containing protein n=1 Tax=Triplophysa tibetana TaxID=1572043 RepID=A0A5A9NMC2_9TELE|nr:hypothetical protein E1301_Tti015735 [Triplophysa tibetana]
MGAAGPSTVNVLPAPSPIVERVVYVPREQRGHMFSGRGEDNVFEWVEEIHSCLRVRHLPLVEQTSFVLDHLEGPAKNEIKYRAREDRETPEQVFSILKELYWSSQSYIALQQNFFSRKQLEGESLQEYSHALFALMDKVVQQAPGGMTNSVVLPRDQFVEHVLDSGLRRELKRFVRLNPDSTLLDVRKEAIRWVEEGFHYEMRERSHSVPTSSALQYRVQGQIDSSGPSDGNVSELTELKRMMRVQQEQLNELTQSLRQIQSQSVGSHPRRLGPIFCRRCNQPGHIARNCTLGQTQFRGQRGRLSHVNVLPPNGQAENCNPLN